MGRSPLERGLGGTAPRRLVDAGATAKERLLLQAGIDEAPPSEAGRKRALAALGLAVSTSTLAHSAGATMGLPKSVALAQAKWLLVGAVSAAVAVGGVQMATQPRPATSRAASASTAQKATTAAKGSAQSAEPLARAPSGLLVPRSAPPPAESERRAPVAAPSDLVAEVAALDRARAALRAGTARQSVALLDKFDRNFPRSSLAPEATVVRVSALLALGERERATKLVRAYCRSGGHGAYGPRLMELVGLSEADCEGFGPGP